MMQHLFSNAISARIAVVCLLFLLAVPTWAGETVEVAIEKMMFVPQRLQIKTGTTVIWINKEKRTNHSLYFEKEGLPESDRIFPGESWQRSFDKLGTYPYRCGPHAEMTGIIEVTE